MNENIETKSLGVGNGRVIRAFGQEAHVLVSSEQTGDAFCVLRFFIPPGNVTPPHLHRATDETFLIESGEIEIKQPRASPTRERRTTGCKDPHRRRISSRTGCGSSGRRRSFTLHHCIALLTTPKGERCGPKDRTYARPAFAIWSSVHPK
jgi:hypothetical protein